MAFIAELRSPVGERRYVSPEDREGLRYLEHTAEKAEQFPTHALAEEAAHQVNRIAEVRDWKPFVWEV